MMPVRWYNETMNDNKMPRGFKLIIILYVLLLVFLIPGFPKLFTQSSLSLIWGIITLAMTVVVIVGIYLKRWGKLISGWFIVDPVARIVGLIQLLALSTADFIAKYPGEIASNPTTKNLSLAQLDTVLNSGKMLGGTLMVASIIVGLFIFLYAYKHRDYFN